MTRAPFTTARIKRKLKLVEAYFMYPYSGAQGLATLCDMTLSEVIEQLERHGLPMGPVFARERARRGEDQA